MLDSFDSLSFIHFHEKYDSIQNEMAFVCLLAFVLCLWLLMWILHSCSIIVNWKVFFLHKDLWLQCFASWIEDAKESKKNETNVPWQLPFFFRSHFLVCSDFVPEKKLLQCILILEFQSMTFVVYFSTN